VGDTREVRIEFVGLADLEDGCLTLITLAAILAVIASRFYSLQLLVKVRGASIILSALLDS